jgi:hypothetical protein
VLVLSILSAIDSSLVSRHIGSQLLLYCNTSSVGDAVSWCILEGSNRSAVNVFALGEHVRVDFACGLGRLQPAERITGWFCLVDHLNGDLRSHGVSLIQLDYKDISAIWIRGFELPDKG